MSELDKATRALWLALCRLKNVEDMSTDEIMEPLAAFIDAKIAAALSEDEGKGK